MANNEFNIVLGGSIDAESVNTSIKSIEGKISSIKLKVDLDLSGIQEQLKNIQIGSNNNIGGAKQKKAKWISDSLLDEIKATKDIDKINVTTNKHGDVVKVVASQYNSLKEVITKTWTAGAKSVEDYTRAVQKNNTQVADNLRLQNENKNTVYKMQQELASYGNQAKLSTKDLKYFQSELNRISKIKSEVEKKDQLDRLDSSIKATANSTGLLGQSLTKAAIKYVTWLSIANVVSKIQNGIKDVIEQVKKLDAALVELNKVADLTKKEMESITKEAFKLGEQVGRTGTDVLKAITEFKRAGFEIGESQSLAKYALIMTNVAEGITDAGTAATYLVSILKGAKLEVSAASKILDEINEISNNSAVSFDALADMTQRVTGTMRTLGNTVEETMALVTGAYEILQDERVAKGISVIGLRIAGLNEDLSEEEGLASNVGDALQKYAKISVFDVNGQLKSTYQILEELAGKWNSLTKNAQTYLTTTLAGKNRADVLSSIMTNWEGVEAAMNQAMDSADSALKEQDAYLNSIAGKQAQLANAWEKLANDTLNSDFVKRVYEFLTGITKLADSLGGLSATLSAILGTILLIKSAKIIHGISKGYIAIKKNKYEMMAFTASTNGAAAAVTKLRVVLTGIGMAVSTIALVASAIKMITSAVEENRKAAIEASKSKIEAIQEEYAKTLELRKEYVELFASQNTNENAAERLLKIREKLVEIYGKEAESLDLINGSYEENSKILDKLSKEDLEKNLNEQKYLLEQYSNSLNKSTTGADLNIFQGYWWHGKARGTVGDLFNEASDYVSGYENLIKRRDAILAGAQETEKGELETLNAKIEQGKESYESYKKTLEEVKSLQNKLAYFDSGLADEVNKFWLDAITFANASITEQASLLDDMQARVDKILISPYYEYNKDEIDSIINAWEEYANVVRNTDFALEALNKQLSALKKQKELDEEELKIQEKLLKVEQARAALAEAKAKRMRVFRAGKGFVYEEDAEAVQSATESLQEALRNAEQTDLDKAIKAIETLQEMYDQAQLDQEEAGLTSLRDYFRNQDNLNKWLAMNYEEKYALLDKYITTRDWNAPASRADISSWVPKNASGTKNFGGGTTLVGEHGAELVNLPAGSEILSHNKTMKLDSIVSNPSAFVGGAGRNTTLQFNGDLSFPNVRNANDAQGFLAALMQIGNKGLAKF